MKVNNKQELLDILSSSELSVQIKVQLTEWLEYKNYKYQSRGLRALLTIVRHKLTEYAESAIIELIILSMSRNWEGICWERLSKEVTPVSRHYSPEFFKSLYDEIEH